jgi:tRNA-2-methylthio-N6-dimethylallyladenosine synthase
MPHIHLPLQAGADRVLSAMGRRYTISHYLALLDSLRQSSPEIAITTDIIVGFPGETEPDFEETLKVLEIAKFDSIFSFKYSDRPGTKAIDLPSKVAEDEKTRRLNLVIKLQKEISLKVNLSLIGRTHELLVDGTGREPGQLSGRTGSFKIVHFPGPTSLIGELIPVTITDAGPVTLKGEMPEGISLASRKSSLA